MSLNSKVFQAVPLDEFKINEITNSFDVNIENSDKEFLNGNYKVRQSSCLDDQGVNRKSNYSATNLFDGRNSTFWQTPYIKSSKTGYQDGYRQDAYENGEYVGGGKNKYHTTMLTDGTTVDGEWAEIQLPYKLLLTDYFFQASTSPKIYTKRFPSHFYVLGSNDGEKWVILDSHNDDNIFIDKNMELPIEFPVKDNLFSYSYYRVVISGMISSDNNNSVTLAEWSLFGKVCMNTDGTCGDFIQDTTENFEGMSTMDTSLRLHETINDFNEQYARYVECKDRELNPYNRVLKCSKKEMNKRDLMKKYNKIISYDRKKRRKKGIVYTLQNTKFNQATSQEVFDTTHDKIINMYENDIHKMRSEINAKMDYIHQKKNSLASDIEDQYHYNRYGGVMLSILATTTLYYVFFRLNK